MTIKQYTNNNVNGFQIFDEQGEYFLTEATEELAIAKYNAIKYREANPPKPSYEELRLREYPSTDDMVVALWESVVEGRHEAKDILQAKRIVVKEKYPKV